MTLQFHTWDKFKLLTSMSTQQISNFAAFHAHLINSGSTTLSILKVYLLVNVQNVNDQTSK